MSATDEARAALARRTAPSDTFQSLLQRQAPAIEQVLGREAERFTRIALTEIKRNPLLQECEPHSVLGALMLCAGLDLEPGPLGHAYFVPYQRQCTFVLGYTGILELARRSERLGSLKAQIVHEGDDYSYHETERGPRLHFKPCPPADRGPRRLVFVRWSIRAGRAFLPELIEVYPDRIERARKASPAARKNSGPWLTDEDAMWRKTAVRVARPFLPLSSLAGRALEADESVVSDWSADSGVVLDAEALEATEGTEA